MPNTTQPMSFLISHRSLFVCLTAFAVGACSNLEFSHVAPGKSARKEIAARNLPITTPLAPGAELPPGTLPTPAEMTQPSAASTNQDPFVPLQPPPLPDIPPAPAAPASNESANQVANAYTRGSEAMKAGKNAEAIAALEEAVKIEPNLGDAWSKLVVLYTQEGNTAKATAAYKKAKALGQQNGPESAGHGLMPLP